MNYNFSFKVGDSVYEIPEYMRQGLINYVEHGIEPGGFLGSVLENDFMGAVMKADGENKKNLPAYAHFLYNEVPVGCYGSPKAVEFWMKYKRG